MQPIAPMTLGNMRANGVRMLAAWCLGCLRAALPITYTDQMCGRFTNRLTWREIVARYRLTMPAVNLQPRYNVAPATNMAAFITGDRGFGRSRSARADAATC
jgi:hypothetical protein